MSTLIDELRVDPPDSRSIPGGPFRRLAPLAGQEPFRRSLAIDPAQNHVRTIGPLERPQTLLLVGDLDSATAVVGRRQLRQALEIGRGLMVLNCSSVGFIDAAWLGVLVSTARYAGQLGRKVSVAAPSPRVLRVLRLVGLEWLVADE
jgi:anti-sigma B factor antagonist